MTKNIAHGLHFGHIAGWCRGALGVDVAHLSVRIQHGQSLTHGALATFTGGGHHIGPVRGGAIAGQLRVDFRAARFGMFQLIEHQDTAAAGDHTPIAVGIIGA